MFLLLDSHILSPDRHESSNSVMSRVPHCPSTSLKTSPGWIKLPIGTRNTAGDTGVRYEYLERITFI